MPGLDLRGLEIFLAVCDHGGLTSAGRALDLTQAAVSQHLAKLERDLGVLLVDRSVRPQRITAAGDYLRQRGRSLFSELDTLRETIGRYRETDIPQLHIGIIESVAIALLPHLVNRLMGRIGKMSITSGTTHPLVPELADGKIDMIVTTEFVEKIPSADSTPLLTEPLVLILPKGTPAPQDWDDVAEIAQKLDFVRYGPKRRLGAIADHAFRRFGVETHGSIEFDSSFALIDRVQRGLAWGATTPLCILGAGASADDITIAPLPSATPVRCVSLVWMAERPSGPPHLVARTCREILSEITIPLLRARACGVEDHVNLAE